MPAELIDGKVVSEKVRNEVAAAVANLPGKPCLAVVLVGDDPASALYVKSKGEKTEAAGMRSITKRFPASATQAEVEASAPVPPASEEVSPAPIAAPADPAPLVLSPTDPVPRIEPAHRGANRPYQLAGRQYVPRTDLTEHRERGVASWYGPRAIEGLHYLGVLRARMEQRAP